MCNSCTVGLKENNKIQLNNYILFLKWDVCCIAPVLYVLLSCAQEMRIYAVYNDFDKAFDSHRKKTRQINLCGFHNWFGPPYLVQYVQHTVPDMVVRINILYQIWWSESIVESYTDLTRFFPVDLLQSNHIMFYICCLGYPLFFMIGFNVYILVNLSRSMHSNACHTWSTTRLSRSMASTALRKSNVLPTRQAVCNRLSFHTWIMVLG